MKRSVFIITGIILAIVLIAVWVYVLFFGTPTSIDEQFANFGVGDTIDMEEPVPASPPPEEEPVVDIETEQRLRQLTTKPVAGFAEITGNASSAAAVLYTEKGTGHVYSINLSTGEEERISGTTIPEAQSAAFSPDGQYVMIESGFGSQKEFIVGQINRDSSSLTNTELAEPITSFSSTDDNRFLYSIVTNASTIGKVFNPVELTNQTLFTLPFRESTIEWGTAVTDSHYIYPKTTRHLESFLYRVKNGDINRMPIDGFGMSAVGNDDSVFYSKQENTGYNSYYFDISMGVESPSRLIHIPEKCTLGEARSAILFCANSEYGQTSRLPDSWYKGEVLSADKLWEITPADGSSKLLVDTEQESGRQLDITNLHFGDGGLNIYFTNQPDQTLWLFERFGNQFKSN